MKIIFGFSILFVSVFGDIELGLGTLGTKILEAGEAARAQLPVIRQETIPETGQKTVQVLIGESDGTKKRQGTLDLSINGEPPNNCLGIIGIKRQDKIPLNPIKRQSELEDGTAKEAPPQGNLRLNIGDIGDKKKLEPIKTLEPIVREINIPQDGGILDGIQKRGGISAGLDSSGKPSGNIGLGGVSVSLNTK